MYTCGEDRTLKVWHVQGLESGRTGCCCPRHFSSGLLAGSELEWSCEQSLAHPETVWHVAELPNQASAWMHEWVSLQWGVHTSALWHTGMYRLHLPCFKCDALQDVVASCGDRHGYVWTAEEARRAAQEVQTEFETRVEVHARLRITCCMARHRNVSSSNLRSHHACCSQQPGFHGHTVTSLCRGSHALWPGRQLPHQAQRQPHKLVCGSASRPSQC